MSFDPATFDLSRLFRDPGMFESRHDWHDAGFEVLRRSSDHKIMVAGHSSVSGYFFKKYPDSVSLNEQLENYEGRIEGSRMVQKFIVDRRLRLVAVPGKWLRELPREFGSRKRAAYVLVVERLPILDEEETVRAYWSIDRSVLRDLCTVLHAFRGLDSTPKNVPFTEDGRVAFIDTEHWDRHSKKKKRLKRPFLKYLREYLSRDRQELADEIFEELEEG